MVTFIYVAECERRFCKIGYSKDPKARISKLRGSNPFDVILVKTYETKELACAKWLEAFIHEEMKKLGHHRWCEWFFFTSQSMFDLDRILESVNYDALNKKAEDLKEIERIAGLFRLSELSEERNEIYKKINMRFPIALSEAGFPEAARVLGDYCYKGSTKVMRLECGALEHLKGLIYSDSELMSMTKDVLKEVAKQTGVHYDVVRRAAQGKDIQYESGRKLAEFLSK